MERESSTVPDLFARCLELEPKECAALLGSLERQQPEVVVQVRELLEIHERHPHFLEQSALEHVTSVDPGLPESPHRRPPGMARWLASRSAAFWLFLGFDFIALGFYVFAAVLTAHYGTQTVGTGFEAGMKAAEWYVASVKSPGPASGKLAVGDRIQAIDGDTAMRGSGFPVAMQSVRPGVSYTIRVLRNGVARDVVLAEEIVHRSKRWDDIVSFGMVSLAFFLTAVVLGILKSDQRVARWGYVALMSEALVLVTMLLSPYQMFLRGSAFLTFETFLALDGVHFVLAYHFYCILFDRVSAARAWKYALYVLYPWTLLILVVRISVDTGRHTPHFNTHTLLVEFAYLLDPVFYVLAPIAICAVIVRNYVKVREPDDRRRARWIALGSLAGILPYIIVRVIGAVLDSTGNAWFHDVYQNAFRISILAAMVIPAATGYAIYKHRMFDIRVVVRRGVRYMLAKSVLRVVLALPALGLVAALLNNAHRTVADAIWNNAWFIVLLAMLAAVLKFRVPLRNWLDRRFFRESYRQEQLLLSLTDSVQKVHSLSEMAQVVGERVTAVLHPESVVVMYRERQDRLFTTAYSAGQPSGELRFSENCAVVSVFETGSEALTLSSLSEERGIPAGDLLKLEGLGIDLIVPMNGTGGDLVGLILLGRRLADEPFTPEDRKLLTALGGQMAMVYENISLHRRLSEQQKAAHDIRSRLEGSGIDGFRECPRCGRCFDLSVTRCPEDGAEPAFSLPIRRTIDRYRLERLIGKGGMGAVYEAEDLELHRKVAVKVILGDRMENSVALQRVYREARSAARLNHPNIIATYDFGILPGDVAYLVMELIPGQTLRAAISSGRIDPAAAREWFDQLLAGAEAAHRAGIIHRDLKPENVLISAAPDGSPLVKILDFGIAKTAGAGSPESASITRPGTVLGSIQYMSPEQLNGEKVDERSDIFSIGVMLFEVLTGRLPFSGNTYTERIISLLHDEVSIPDASLRGGRLESLLKKCLAREPQQRFASVGELRREFGTSVILTGATLPT